MNPLNPADYYEYWFGDGADFTWSDLITYDFWSLGGTTSFFSSADMAHDWVSKHIWSKYTGFEGMSEAADYPAFMIAMSEQARNEAQALRLAGGLSRYEEAELYWGRMNDYTWAVLDPNEHPELKKWFTESVDIAERTVAYDEGGILNPNPEGVHPDEGAKIPWWLVGIAAIYLWKK